MPQFGLLTLAQAAPTGGGAPPAPSAPLTPAAPAMPAAPAAGGDGTTLVPGGAGATGGTGGAAPAPSAGPSMLPMVLLLVIIAVFLFISTMGQRKERKKRAALLEAVKKGDRVQTIGGMIGTVVEVRDSDVIVKVDEQSNTRIKFVKSAIQTILETKTES